MNFDDPKITAYALGELDSPDEREAVEQLLKEHPELATELEETRAIGNLLRRELHTEEAAPLAPHQREYVLQAAAGDEPINGHAASIPPNKVTAFPWWRRKWVPSAVAATVVLTTGIAVLWQQQQPRYVAVSRNSPHANPALPELQQSIPPQSEALPQAALPSAAPSEKLNRLADESKTDFDTGRFDLAQKRANEVLTLDSANVEGRKMKEQVGKKADEDVIAGRNQTRSLSPAAGQPAPSQPTSGPETPVDVGSRLKVAAATNAPQESRVKQLAEVAPKSETAPAAPLHSLTRSLATGQSEVMDQTRGGDLQAPAKPATTAPAPSLPASIAGRTATLAKDSAPAPYYYRGPGVAGDQTGMAPTAGNARGGAVRDWDRGSSGHIGESPAAEPAQGTVRLQLVDRLESEQLGRDARQQVEPSNTESYDQITDNAFMAVKDNPLSTFSIDVDTASYANVRRFLMNNQRPPKGAVRIEELVNYFPYSYTPPAPESTEPFSVAMETAAAPWAPEHRLVRVALKGREIAREKLPPSNLVFLVDVSGSMTPANKLPLVQQSLLELVNQLREQDTVGIVVYAGSTGVVLEPTSDKAAVRSAIERMQSGGSTNGAAGIQQAYDLAQRAFKKEGNNRVILATDGDFNVGVTNQSELIDLIQRRAKSGVFLSVLGFGMGNVKDSTMEKLADKGNGNYAYIDSLREGRKVLVEEMSGTLFTIAKDVKIQVEFNPAKVGAYRLIGYENRILAKEDFNDDTKDAGEVGAGHTVTALYEVVPSGQPIPVDTTVDPLKYQQTLTFAPSAGTPAVATDPSGVQKTDPLNYQKYLLQGGTQPTANVAQNPPLTVTVVPQGADTAAGVRGGSAGSEELLTLKLRYKAPDGEKSTLKEYPLTDRGAAWNQSTPDFRWAAAVASFGMLLRDSPHRGNATWDAVAELAREGKGEDRGGYRAEFLGLIDRARQLVPVTPLVTTKPETKPVAENKAAKLMLAEFDAADTAVLDVIDSLSKKSKELDPEKSGVPIVYSGPAANGQLKVSFRMRNISVLEAARTVANIAGLALEEQSGTLHLKAPATGK